MRRQKRRDIIEEQAARLRFWPKDRIPFHHSADAAFADVREIMEWKQGRIDLAELCVRVAGNNFLERVTPIQMLTEMLIIGYIDAAQFREETERLRTIKK